MEALAAEAAIALDRTRSAAALDRALERERLVAKISRRVRSVLDLDAVTRVAVDRDRARARRLPLLHQARRPGRRACRSRAEWGGRARADRRQRRGPAGLEPRRAERRTVAVADVLEAPELADAVAGRASRACRARRARRARDAGVVFDRDDRRARRCTGREPGPWSAGEVALAEAVAARDRARAAHGAAAARERAPARPSRRRCCKRRPGRDERARAATPCCSGSSTRWQSCSTPTRRTATCSTPSAACSAARPCTGSLEALVGFEFPADRGLAGSGDRAGPAGASRDDYASLADADPAPGLRGLHAARSSRR